MPNHVTNEIRIIGTEERVAAFFHQAKQTVEEMDFQGKRGLVEREFSFCGFVPPPEHPDYTSGGCSHSHLEFRGDKAHLDPNPNCWYAWNPDNWGTKWDAYDVKVGGPNTILDRLARSGVGLVEEVVQFDTAWSPPFPVFEKITKLYPDCRFEFSWMDEDMRGGGGGFASANHGVLGKVTDRIDDPDDPETGAKWWQLATNLMGYSPERHEERLAEIAEDERLAAERAASQGA